MNYDPTQAQDPEQWLQADESARVDAVYTWFVESGFRNEDEALSRAAVLATLETQVASRDPSVVAETLEQLESEGLERLLAMFAMASVLDEMLREITSQKTEFDLDAYKKRIRELDLELIETTAANNQPFGGEPPPFDSSQQRLLESFTERHADDEVLSFPATAGFLLAVACAPRLALPSEWLPCLIGDIEFDTQQESEAVVGAIMSLLNWILDQAQSPPSQPLPADCRPDRDPMANLEEGSRFGQWCEGLAVGQTVFELDWEDALIDDHQRMRLSGSFTTLSFFSSPEVASEVRSELASLGERMPLKKLASLMHRSIPDAIADYVDLGYQLREGPRRSSSPKQPARSQKIGRNQPCSCGSGKKYKKCCGRPGA